MMHKKHRSDISAAIHETMRDLHEIGLVDKRTMKRFDRTCLTPIAPLSPRRIRAIRQREKVSQGVFASYLYVTPGLVSQWERGKKKPRGASLKLLTLVAAKGLDAIA